MRLLLPLRFLVLAWFADADAGAGAGVIWENFYETFFLRHYLPKTKSKELIGRQEWVWITGTGASTTKPFTAVVVIS